MGWATEEQQVCLAHLLRDVRYALEAGDDALAPRLTALLKRAVRIGRRRPALADATLAAYHARLQAEIDALLGIVPATEAGRKLRRIVKRFRQNLLVFVTNRAVPPTNNGSEQALRPCVVFRKVTNWTSPLGVKGSLTNPSTRGGQDGGEEDPAPVHGRVQGGGGPAPARGR